MDNQKNGMRDGSNAGLPRAPTVSDPAMRYERRFEI
jgi:hypothetical protein